MAIQSRMQVKSCIKLRKNRQLAKGSIKKAYSEFKSIIKVIGAQLQYSLRNNNVEIASVLKYINIDK
jgi:hypothetical protein